MAKTIFQRIIDREISAQIVFEDEHCIAFHDVNPQAPVHVLLVPKRPIASLDELTEADTALAGHMLIALSKLPRQLGLKDGYRIVNNCGPDGGQTVDHLHFHLLGQRALGWPPG